MANAPSAPAPSMPAITQDTTAAGLCENAVAITPAVPTILLGTTLQFHATGTYSDGTMQDITATASWTSDQPSLASVGNSPGSQGLATGIAAGTANITATIASVSATSAASIAPRLFHASG